MRITLTLILSGWISLCFAQTDTLREVCFAKTYVLTFDQEEDFVFPEWAAEDDIFSIRMVSKKVIDKPKSMRWMKKKADKSCLSANPEDCTVWCKVEVPATFKIIKEFNDETPPDFSTDEYFKTRFKNLTGSLEWHPVLCSELFDKKVIRQLIHELKAEKYLAEYARIEMTEKAWAALFQFQVDFKLPVGNLNLATLDFMNLEY